MTITVNNFNRSIGRLILGLLSISLFPCLSFGQISAQDGCIQCSGTTTTGTTASAVGTGNTASGNYSFAGGFNSTAGGTTSFAFGNRATTSGSSSVSIGQFINITASTAMGLGVGFDINNPLINNVPRSFIIGIGSTKPTFFVSQSVGVNNTGKIGIGNVTDPQAKLHIRADETEDASLLLDPAVTLSSKAVLNMINTGTGLIAEQGHGLELYTDLGHIKFTANRIAFKAEHVDVPVLRINDAYSLPTTAGQPGEFLSSDGTWSTPAGSGGSSYWLPSGSNIYYGNAVGIGMEPKERLSLDSPSGRPIHFHLGGSQGVNSNAYYDGSVNRRSEEGPAYQIGFSSNDMSFRAAVSGAAGSVVNWNQAMVVTQDGKVGIGTTSTFGYQLAVLGKILTDEIVVKLYEQWPDYVFSPGYRLMPLAELQQFIRTNSHLPGLPDAQKVAEEGVPVGEMNALLLQKIEELTLYILEQQQELKLQKQEIEDLKEKLED